MYKAEINKVIRNRKTVYPTEFLREELSEKLVKEILTNATYAPTHRMTQPWHFKVYRGKSKDALCKIINKIDKKNHSEIKINKFIQKIRLSDTVVSIILTRDSKELVPEWEEIAAVSMAVQNMWLSCYVNNIGSYWSTPKLKDDYARHINLDINQRSLGFFFMGRYNHKETSKLRDDITQKVELVKN